MKKKFFMLLAAVLLGSVSAFAQSGNNNPAKGDVNEDGMVDVADINAILKIMKDGGGPVAVGGYFYLGTTKPTAENYKTLPGVVTSFTSFDAAVGATASVAAGQTLYLLCPAAWMKGKTPTLEDKDGNSISFLEEKDETTISDYVIYETQVWNAPNDVVLKTSTDVFYFGTTKPTSSNYQSLTPQYTSSSQVYNKTVNVTGGSNIYYLCPNSKALTTEQRKAAMLDQGGNFVKFSTEIDTTSISGYTIYVQSIVNSGILKFNVNY